MNAEQIKSMLNAEYGKALEKRKSEAVEFVKDSEITICIKAGDDYDHYSLADRLEDILDDIPAIKDFIIFTR